MSKSKFSDFMRELKEEALAESPEAVKELETFQEYFRLAREMAAARRSKGLTQRQLADRTGVNQSEISDIERGQANPTFRTLQTLAKGVGYRIALVRAAKRSSAARPEARRTRPRAADRSF